MQRPAGLTRKSGARLPAGAFGPLQGLARGWMPAERNPGHLGCSACSRGLRAQGLTGEPAAWRRDKSEATIKLAYHREHGLTVVGVRQWQSSHAVLTGCVEARGVHSKVTGRGREWLRSLSAANPNGCHQTQVTPLRPTFWRREYQQ